MSSHRFAIALSIAAALLAGCASPEPTGGAETVEPEIRSSPLQVSAVRYRGRLLVAKEKVDDFRVAAGFEGGARALGEVASMPAARDRVELFDREGQLVAVMDRATGPGPTGNADNADPAATRMIVTMTRAGARGFAQHEVVTDHEAAASLLDRGPAVMGEALDGVDRVVVADGEEGSEIEVRAPEKVRAILLASGFAQAPDADAPRARCIPRYSVAFFAGAEARGALAFDCGGDKGIVEATAFDVPGLSEGVVDVDASKILETAAR